MSGSYHRFVFDEVRRTFVGAFEEMYRAEASEHFDSWHQDDLTSHWRAITLAMAEHIRARSVLDVGCGKGALTARLRAERVVGIDVSETALARARERVPTGEFIQLPAERVGELDRHFELAVCLEVLSYVETWPLVIGDLARVANHLLVSLYLPPATPIGFVKSFDEFRAAFTSHFDVECDALLHEKEVDGARIILLGSSRAPGRPPAP